MNRLYIDDYGNVTPRRPMTLQENYGMPRNVSAGQIPYTGGGQVIGRPSGISRPGIASGTPQATQVPVNPRRVPVPRPTTVPVESDLAPPPVANQARGFTMGQEGATVSPARPTRPIARLTHAPAEPLKNIDAEVRARINSGSRRFVGPQQPEVMPIATPGNSVVFGGRGSAQPVLPGGGLAGELYRRWSDSTGRYIPGLEQAWGGKPTAYREIADFARNEIQRQSDSASGQEVRQPLPPRASMSRSIADVPTAPVDVPLHYENLGLGPNDLSRTSTGRIPTPVKPVGIAGGEGTGFATVGGKRINYQDIGTRQDQLSSRRTDGIATAPDGQTAVLGNAAGYRPSRDVDWSPGSANERNAQLEAADRLGMTSDGRGDFRPMNQGERDAAGLTTQQEYVTRNNQDIQNQLGIIAGNTGNMYDGDEKITAAKMRIAALQGQNAQLQQGIAGDQTLAGQKYMADAGVAAHRITGQATVDAARLGAEGRERAALVEGLSEQHKQQNADRQAVQKRRDEREKSYLNRYDWGKISPTAANEYAGLLADTDGKGYVTLRDPSGTHGDILIHQNIEQALRGAYGKIRTADQFQAYLNQARKLGAGQAPVYQTQIKNTANLPLIRSKQDQLLEGINNG